MQALGWGPLTYIEYDKNIFFRLNLCFFDRYKTKQQQKLHQAIDFFIDVNFVIKFFR